MYNSNPDLLKRKRYYIIKLKKSKEKIMDFENSTILEIKVSDKDKNIFIIRNDDLLKEDN